MLGKNNSRRITVAEMAPHVHNFLPNENKVEKISDWLADWIVNALKNGQIKPNDYLPTKSDLAFHLSVSLGTMQNVFKIVEDKGLVSSKQRLGTYIRDKKENVEKLTSKRDVACEILKQYIKTKLQPDETIPSTRMLSKELAIPPSTIRIAINKLMSDGILERKSKYFIVKTTKFKIYNTELKTVTEKVAGHISEYIKKNLSKGDKLPSGNTLADMYGVSLKTIHDAIKILSVAGVVKTRRGYYGTYVNDEDNTLYYYEQVELKIKQYVIDNCKIGDKLPTIKEFAEVFNVSSKTIKNALDNLAKDGYINFLRGRNGGTFVVELPVISGIGYEWLALSKEFETL